ncbi:hypothetical protein PAPYR_3384 [Paratrimastix pyriformis]|uniref:Uncharacterized protein n=1 Tax=Paratrimastix pyriformis TaxID=342808 RepID=A0ABQ8USP0_9EUKA|nr:hypothetical protein PAPYR_3384 [Paratrimastix pyriformis]
MLFRIDYNPSGNCFFEQFGHKMDLLNGTQTAGREQSHLATHCTVIRRNGTVVVQTPPIPTQRPTPSTRPRSVYQESFKRPVTNKGFDKPLCPYSPTAERTFMQQPQRPPPSYSNASGLSLERHQIDYSWKRNFVTTYGSTYGNPDPSPVGFGNGGIQAQKTQFVHQQREK